MSSNKHSPLTQASISLARNCHGAYLKARPKIRRRFNEAVLKAVYIKDGKVKKAEFNDPFDAVFSRPSSNRRLKVEVSGHYQNRFPLLQELLSRRALQKKPPKLP